MRNTDDLASAGLNACAILLCIPRPLAALWQWSVAFSCMTWSITPMLRPLLLQSSRIFTSHDCNAEKSERDTSLEARGAIAVIAGYRPASASEDDVSAATGKMAQPLNITLEVDVLLCAAAFPQSPPVRPSALS